MAKPPDLLELETRLAALEARIGPAPQAVPPVTIGELGDVPAPGSPIASQWATEVTRRSLHRFANVATRDANYPAAGAGAGAVCVTLDTNTEWVSNGTTWLPTGYGLARLQLLANFSGPATNGAAIPWAASSNVGGFTPGATVAFPANSPGLYAITVSITYTAGTVTASAYYSIVVGGTTFPVAHGNVGGTAATLVVQLAAGATLQVVVNPGVNMGGATCNLWITRIGP